MTKSHNDLPQNSTGNTAQATSATPATGKPRVPVRSVREWSDRVIQRTNEIAMNEDLRKEIAKLTK